MGYLDDLNEIASRFKLDIEHNEYECDKCEDKGFIYFEEDGIEYSKECECHIRARELERTKRHIENSNLNHLLGKMTFENYITDSKPRENIKERAEEYLESDSWWFISGKSGIGKTHITTAICSEMMNRGIPVYYMNWKDESVKLKTSMLDKDYQTKLNRLKNTEVLYIDDLFKGSFNDKDVDLLYIIINSRYMQNKKTLISSEKSLDDIRKIDEAIGSRIYEMTDKRYVIKISKLENARYEKE